MQLYLLIVCNYDYTYFYISYLLRPISDPPSILPPKNLQFFWVGALFWYFLFVFLTTICTNIILCFCVCIYIHTHNILLRMFVLDLKFLFFVFFINVPLSYSDKSLRSFRFCLILIFFASSVLSFCHVCAVPFVNMRCLWQLNC